MKAKKKASAKRVGTSQVMPSMTTKKRTTSRLRARRARNTIERFYPNPETERPVVRQLKEAVHLYQKFHGEVPKFVTQMRARARDKYLLQIGTLEGVMYSAKRDGVTKKYLHQFDRRSAPILASSYDGKQLYVIGGDYDFTEDGIVDRPNKRG